MSNANALILIIAILLATVFGLWLEVYRYHDCKKVGHTTFYCITDIGTKS